MSPTTQPQKEKNDYEALLAIRMDDKPIIMAKFPKARERLDAAKIAANWLRGEKEVQQNEEYGWPVEFTARLIESVCISRGRAKPDITKLADALTEKMEQHRAIQADVLAYMKTNEDMNRITSKTPDSIAIATANWMLSRKNFNGIPNRRLYATRVLKQVFSTYGIEGMKEAMKTDAFASLMDGQADGKLGTAMRDAGRPPAQSTGSSHYRT